MITKTNARRSPTKAFQSRTCAICNRSSGAITGMRAALKNLGLEGGYAHHNCYSRYAKTKTRGETKP